MNTIVVSKNHLAGFLPKEQIYLCSEKTRTRLEQAEYKGLGPIRVLFSNQPLIRLKENDPSFFWVVGYGEISSTNNLKFEGPAWKQEHEDLGDYSGVTFRCTNNGTAKESYMGLTPWILAHRMFHGFETDNQTIANLSVIDQFMEELWHQHVPLMFQNVKMATYELNGGRYVSSYDTVYGPTTTWTEHPTNFRGCWRILNFYRQWPGSINELLKAIGTFRSARVGKLMNGEFFPEIWAQFAVTGSVRFNSHAHEPTNAILQKYEPLINEAFRNQVEYLKGKVVSF